MKGLKQLVERIYPLDRTVNSDGLEEAVRLVQFSFPGAFGVEYFRPGQKYWDWPVPRRWRCGQAFVERDGERLVDRDRHLLHLVGHSVAVDGRVGWEDLRPRLHFGSRPGAIPWEQTYYRDGWGFCLPPEQAVRFGPGSYRVLVEAEFTDDPMPLGVGTVGDGPDEFILTAHLCHPAQANDDAAGAAALVGAAELLAGEDLSLTCRFLFGAETIGTISYLYRHGWANVIGGLHLDMAGNDNGLLVQSSLTADSDVDLAVLVALGGTCTNWRPLRSGPVNDELVLNYAGVPAVGLSRWHYPEYHTSLDAPGIIREDRLREAARAVADVVLALDRGRKVYRRNSPVPPFLTGLGLWRDAAWHRDVDRLCTRLDGRRSLLRAARDGSVRFGRAVEVAGALEDGGWLSC